MFNFIGFKKITTISLLGFLMAGNLANQSGNNKAIAASCSNNGHGNNLPSRVTFDSGTKTITISGFDPSNPSDRKANQLIDDLVDGNFGYHRNSYTITYSGSPLTQAQAEYVVNNIVDIEKAKAGCDQDGDGIDDITESGSDQNNPLDTDNDGLPNHLDTDSDGDGILDQNEVASNQDNSVNYVTIDSKDGYLDWTDVDSADFGSWKKSGNNGERDDLVRVYYHQNNNLYIKVSVQKKEYWDGIVDARSLPSYATKYLQNGTDYYPYAPKITNYSTHGTGKFDGHEMFLIVNDVDNGVGSNTITIEYFSDEALTIPAEVHDLNFTLTDLDGKKGSGNVNEKIVLTATDSSGSNSLIGFDRPSGSQIDDSQMTSNTIIGYDGYISNEKGNVGVVMKGKTHKVEVLYGVSNPENRGDSKRHLYISDLAWSGEAAPLVPGKDIDLKDLYTPNQPPVADDDLNNSTPNNQPLTIAVLNNDSDPDNDPLSILDVSDPSSGSVSITGDKKSLLYTPNRSFTGSTSFTYTVKDPDGATDQATVTVNITSNEAPNAADGSVTTPYNTAITIDAINDYVTDPDGDIVMIENVTFSGKYLSATGSGSLQTDNGQVTISNGQIVYTPNDGVSGGDSFNYTVKDAAGNEDSGQITVNVNPLASNFVVDTPYGTAKVIDNSTYGNYIGGNGLTLDGVSLPASGETSLSQNLRTTNGEVEIQNGEIIYTPKPGFSNRSETFSYTISDNAGNTSSANITVNVGRLYAD